MRRQRVTDIAINKTAEGWRLQIPIETGSIELRIESGSNKDLEDFLSTALATPSRRFGEDPIVR
jgi:hypothetical protein